MKRIFLSLIGAGLCVLNALGQESGNRNYNRTADRGKSASVGTGGNANELFIEAYVLLNATPDEFVAVFGASQEAATAVESNEKLNARIEQFLDAAAKLGINRDNTFVDFITQNRVYNFAPASDGTTRESLNGFETKKTITVRYKERPVLEKLLTAAARALIYDLIKVDYVVKDLGKVRGQLFDEAVRVVKQKEDTYSRSLGLPIRPQSLSQETYDTHYPAELYQTYTAFESGSVDANYDSRTRVVHERKSSTSFLDPLDRSVFDTIIDSTGVEPMVQCTLYMKLRYTLAP